ncbi:hypothetical protein FDI26_gp41 [Arthrobacter phage Beans]|uniref:Uncharacterized protein n=1 Tax=Arthrobacter phage Beans TaxID=2015815 RepID=A0A222ZJ12_9CAUD|nr:hypothetical protein FDI26_gp41 [Arthrobacter phage Beans]ASR84716.1 hypothetical protein SEA_BEANS_41 [Arthrobacter phage Beans]
MTATSEARNVADARAALYKIKQARQPITEAIDTLQEHIEHLTKQLADTRVVDQAMLEAEQRAQGYLDQALEQHEDAAAERLRLQIDADAERLREPGIRITLDEKQQRDIDAAVEPILRAIKDNPQA